jgi:hypothetical protein
VSRKKRLIFLVIGGLAIVVVLICFGLYFAVQYEPAFYRNAVQIDPAALEKGSDQMLQKTAALTSAVKKRGRWEALFTAEQVNGWLAVDLVKNHPNTLPPGFYAPRVAVEPTQVTLACRYEHGVIHSVLSLTVEPYMPEPNILAMRIIKARIGLLPAPLGQVVEGISRAARDMELQLAWRSAGGCPVALLSLPQTDNNRAVRIETLQLGEGEVYVQGTAASRK